MYCLPRKLTNIYQQNTIENVATLHGYKDSRDTGNKHQIESQVRALVGFRDNRQVVQLHYHFRHEHPICSRRREGVITRP